MKNLISLCLALILCPALLVAQLDDGSIISDDLLLKVTPGSAEFQGVEPGDCRSAQFSIYNIGEEKLTISAFYIEEILGDGFNLGTPSRRSFDLNPDEFFSVRVDFCPGEVGQNESELVVEYSEGNKMNIPLTGIAGKVFDMDWGEDFNDWETGESIGEGWTIKNPENCSVYVDSFCISYLGFWKWEKPLFLSLESNALIIHNQTYYEM